MKPFIQMTDEEFMKGLYQEITNLSPEKLLSFPGIEEILTEQLNDTIVSQWEEAQKLPVIHSEESTL